MQAHPDQVQLLVAVVHYKTKLFRPRKVSSPKCDCFLVLAVIRLALFTKGVCTSWLANLVAEDDMSKG